MRRGEILLPPVLTQGGLNVIQFDNTSNPTWLVSPTEMHRFEASSMSRRQEVLHLGRNDDVAAARLIQVLDELPGKMARVSQKTNPGPRDMIRNLCQTVRKLASLHRFCKPTRPSSPLKFDQPAAADCISRSRFDSLLVQENPRRLEQLGFVQ